MSGKVALVTGAGKRIGQAVAVHLASIGYDIAIHYSSSESGANETKRKIEKLGRKAVTLQADLAEIYAPKELITQTGEIFGGLDLLVNSASTYPEPDKIESQHSFHKESEEEWDEAIAVNTRAPFFLIKYASPFLAKSQNGLAINILDRAVDDLMPSRAAHTVSKNALKIITDLGAATFDNFRVCSLLLGRILPGEKMNKEEVSQIKWVGIEPVLEKISEIINDDESGKLYKVV